MKRKLRLLAILILSMRVESAEAQTVVEPGYTISNYFSGQSSPDVLITGMAIDPVTHTLFFAGPDFSSSSPLYRVDPNGTVTNLGAFTSPAGYPYVATDIQYSAGNIYAGAFGGLAQISSSGTGQAFYPISGFAQEQGLAAVGNTEYVTSGTEPPGQLAAFDTTTATVSLLSIAGLPSTPSSLEYDPVTGLLYTANVNSGVVSFYSINLTLHVATPLPSTTTLSQSAAGNFAVDPNEQFIYTRVGSQIDRIAIATGALTTFVTGLNNNGNAGEVQDLVFGTSSSGGGYSLYIGDGAGIDEVQGFAAPEAVPEPATWLSAAVLATSCFLHRVTDRKRRGI
jgi:hypothetical protein